MKYIRITLLLFLGAVIISDFTMSSCATRSAPTGGPRDTLPPSLDTSYPPNQSINFSAQRIRLVFDEYLSLKSGQQQMMISPPLSEKPTIKSSGREVLIEFEDTLRQNTTYIISFGSAITDFTEGNVNEEIRYVFSTGSYIDSLSLSGSLSDAFSGEVPKDIMVALYRDNQIEKRDSFLYKQLPNYYSFLSEQGAFKMTNLRAGNYRLVAFEDKDGDFKLNKGTEKMAFWPELITLKADTTYNYELQSFEPSPDFKFKNAIHSGKGLIKFAFSKEPDSLDIKPLDIPEDSAFFQKRPGGDSLYYWFNVKRDSINFLLNGQGGFRDSLYTVSLRNRKTPSLRLKPEREELRSFDTIVLHSNLPLSNVLNDSILELTNDSSRASLSINPQEPLELLRYPPFKTNIAFNFKPNSVKSWYQAKMDSAFLKFSVLKGDDLGSIDLRVVTDTIFQYILRVNDPKGRQVKQAIFTDSTTVVLRKMPPGAYKAYLIQDVDRDSTWTTGNFWRNRLPEARLEFKEKLEIRANWEQDIRWKVKPE